MQKVTLAGRTFHAVENSTLQHAIASCAMLQRMGLSDLVPRPGEADSAFRDRLMNSLVTSGELLPLLGHLMMPATKKGAEWTPFMAVQTAKFLGALKTPEDKAKLTGLIIDVTLFFCSAAIGSILTSQRFSPSAAAAMNLFQTAARVSSDTGVRLSAT